MCVQLQIYYIFIKIVTKASVIDFKTVVPFRWFILCRCSKFTIGSLENYIHEDEIPQVDRLTEKLNKLTAETEAEVEDKKQLIREQLEKIDKLKKQCKDSIKKKMLVFAVCESVDGKQNILFYTFMWW